MGLLKNPAAHPIMVPEMNVPDTLILLGLQKEA